MKFKIHDSRGFARLAKRLNTPHKVQAFLRETFSYNFEHEGETLRSAAEALRVGHAHCLEASMVAAAILEHQGYPPLVMSMESSDQIDHVVFIFKERTGWGSIGRSREPGLHGRAPVFRSIRNLALSYTAPFVDKTGSLTGFGSASLDDCGVDWRFSKKNVWKAEQYLIDLPHQDFKSSRSSRLKEKRLHARYLAQGPIQTGKHWW